MTSLVYNQQFNNQKVRENNVNLHALPAGWILRSVVNFSYLYHLIKGMRPKICGNWVLLIYLKIPTSLLEDYSLDIHNFIKIW